MSLELILFILFLYLSVQAVRDIAVLDEKRFLSCSNDCTIKVWSVENSSGNNSYTFEAIKTIHASENFIYTMATLPPNPEENTWVAAGENSGIMVYSGNEVRGETKSDKNQVKMVISVFLL